MKKPLSIIVVLVFVVATCAVSTPRSARAGERALQNIFMDTMFGLGTGTIIAAAVTVADGNAHSDDWGRNLGIGAAIGAFVGAGFGFATETQSLMRFDAEGLTFHMPLPRPKTFLRSGRFMPIGMDLITIHF